MKNELIYCPLGGAGEIGMNMNLFAYGEPENHRCCNWTVAADARSRSCDDLLGKWRWRRAFILGPQGWEGQGAWRAKDALR